MARSQIHIWAWESDYDREAVLNLAQQYVLKMGLDVQVTASGRSALKPGESLRSGTLNYLKQARRVIFVLDRDGNQSQAQRRREPNSLINQVEKVVAEFPDSLSPIPFPLRGTSRLSTLHALGWPHF